MGLIAAGLFVASCTVESEVAVQQADESVESTTAPPSGETTTAQELPATEPPTTDDPEALTVFGGAYREPEGIHPADDPFYIQRSSPALPDSPELAWQVTAPRFTLSRPLAVGDVVTYVTASPANTHTVEARSLDTGELLWTHGVEASRVQATRVIDGLLFVDWVEPPFGEQTIAIDPATGALIADPPEPYPALLGGSNQVLGFVDLVKFGESSITRLDTTTFEPIGTTFISDREFSEVEALALTRDALVMYDEGVLLAFNSDGSQFGEWPMSSTESPVLSALGRDSDAVIIEFVSAAAAFDVRAGRLVWEREAFALQPFRTIDGELFATSPCCYKSELYSLETGETRCQIDTWVEPARNGFYGEHTAYNLDCEPMWRIPASEAAESAAVENGVLRWERVGEDIELAFFG